MFRLVDQFEKAYMNFILAYYPFSVFFLAPISALIVLKLWAALRPIRSFRRAWTILSCVLLIAQLVGGYFLRQQP